MKKDEILSAVAAVADDAKRKKIKDLRKKYKKDEDFWKRVQLAYPNLEKNEVKEMLASPDSDVSFPVNTGYASQTRMSLRRDNEPSIRSINGKRKVDKYSPSALKVPGGSSRTLDVKYAKRPEGTDMNEIVENSLPLPSTKPKKIYDKNDVSSDPGNAYTPPKSRSDDTTYVDEFSDDVSLKNLSKASIDEIRDELTGVFDASVVEAVCNSVAIERHSVPAKIATSTKEWD